MKHYSATLVCQQTNGLGNGEGLPSLALQHINGLHNMFSMV